jgi:TPP-dependent pyruvate/acetoin dehydrogenase alpha subunit
MGEKNHLVGEVIRNRQAQLNVNQMISNGEFRIPIHLALGHEAIAVSVSAAMESQDKILLNHRNIHYHLALGATEEQLIQEYKLANSGLAAGKYGSMNLLALQNRNIYTSNILGNNLAVALGVAQSSKLNSQNSVIWVVTGDGAIEEGVFYETLLCASSWNLPLIVIVENNKWSLGTEIKQRRKEIDLSELCKSLNVEYAALNGNELPNYFDTLLNLREAAEQGAPHVVEVHLETLGGYFVDEIAGKRYINYHAGKAAVTSENSELVFSESPSDPVFVNSPKDLKLDSR